MNDLMINNINAPIRRTPQLIAAEINSIKDQTRRMVLYNSIEIGRRLVEAKEMLEHGEWGEWLEKSVDYSKSTANNLMRIFQEYGAEQITLLGDNAKSQALGSLSYTQAVALLGIPEEERESFVQEHDMEGMSTRELQQAIKEKNEALEKLKNAKEAAEMALEENRKLINEKEEAKRDARLSEQVLRDTQKDVKALQEALKKEKEVSKQTLEALDKAIVENQKLLEIAQKAGNVEEAEKLQLALDELNNELENSKSRIADLEQQLQDKPLDVITATEVVEKIPEEVLKELQDLREKANKPADIDKAAVKFSVQFDELVKKFNDLLNTIPGIEGEEKQGKYKNAVRSLLAKMGESL